jgi:predicted nucleic acid-binding protein
LIVLDTNVVSELMKDTPDRSVARWFGEIETISFLSAIVIGETAFGIAKLPDGARKSKLSMQLESWQSRFANRTLSFVPTMALLYGNVLSEARRAGKPMSIPDAQIAATAREHNAILATRNIKDFSTTGLRLIDPWTV